MRHPRSDGNIRFTIPYRDFVRGGMRPPDKVRVAQGGRPARSESGQFPLFHSPGHGGAQLFPFDRFNQIVDHPAAQK